MKLWAKWLVSDAEKGTAGHEKTDFRSTETGVTEGEEEKEPSPKISAPRMYMREETNIIKPWIQNRSLQTSLL